MSLRELRLKAGLTQKELSLKSGVNIRQIQRVELGTSRMENVTLVNAKRLSDALGVKIEDLIDEKALP
jgi:transcriptional regulator with XRE-family HTH domain